MSTLMESILAGAEVQYKKKKEKKKKTKKLTEADLTEIPKTVEVGTIEAAEELKKLCGRVTRLSGSQDALDLTVLFSRISNYAAACQKQVLPNANASYTKRKDAKGKVITEHIKVKGYKKNPCWSFSDTLTKLIEQVAEDKDKEKKDGIARKSAAEVDYATDRAFSVTN